MSNSTLSNSPSADTANEESRTGTPTSLIPGGAGKGTHPVTGGTGTGAMGTGGTRSGHGGGARSANGRRGVPSHFGGTHPAVHWMRRPKGEFNGLGLA